MSSPPNLSNLTNYEIVTGRRKGSILYKSNSFLYTKVKATPTTISLICQLRESLGCSASASIKTATNILQELRPHNHEPDAHDYELLVLKNRLKEEASKSPASNREIFNATSRQFPLEVASRVSFPQVVRQMSRRKLGTYPRIPGSISEFVNLLEENSNLRINFQSHIFEDNEVVSTLFFSTRATQNIANFDDVCYDGTFFIVPKIFTQLFVISVRIETRFIPVFFILMTTKLYHHYLLVLNKIKILVPGFLPKLAIGDFEKASMGAWRDSFPDIKIRGCLFHYKQAIVKKLASLNLKSFFCKNPSANCFFNLFMGLGFLPQNKMIETFQLLSSAQFGNDIQMSNIRKFLRYFERTWLIDTSVINWFDAECLTNNFSETFNKQLKHTFKVHHANPWVFIEKMDLIFEDLNLEIARIRNGLVTTRQRNPNTLQTVSEDLKRRYLDGDVTSINFLIEHLNINMIAFQSLNIQF